MKIKQITIYGFGKWVDATFDLSKNSFHCIYGRNESGKSTLQKFILFMLFGLPPKQRAFYQPKTSSKMGGRLTLTDERIGEYTIERIDDRSNGKAICMLPDGSIRDEQWLTQQLKGMNKDIYKSIFAFSAIDLHALKDMKGADFGAVLLGIGLTGSTHIHTIEKKLDQRLGALFKPTGKVPKINEQMQILENTHEEMITYKKKEATYETKRREQDRTEQLKTNLEKKVEEEKEQQLLFEKKQRAQPYIHAYIKAKEKENKLPDEIAFPTDGIKRLHNYKEQLLPIESELHVLNQTEEQVDVTCKRLEKDMMSEESRQKAGKIIQHRQLFLTWVQELTEIEEEVKTITTRLDEGIKELQVELSAEGLKEVKFPFHIEQLWKDLQQRSEQLRMESDQVEDEIRVLTKQKQKLHQELKLKEDELLTNEEVQAAKEQINEQKEFHMRDHLTKMNRNKQANWLKEKSEKEKSMMRLFLASIVLTLFICIVAKVISLNILYFVAVITFIIGLGQLLFQKQSIKSTEHHLFDDLYVLAEDLDTSNESVIEAEDNLTLNSYVESQVQSLHEQLKATETHRIKWTERQLQLKQREDQLQNQIMEQFEMYPFLKVIHISFWPDLLLKLKELKELQEVLQQLEDKREDRDRDIVLFTNNVEMFFNEIEQTKTEEIEEQLKQVATIIEENDKAEIIYEEQQNLLHNNRQKQEQLKEKERLYKKEIKHLYDKAGVDSEEEFYKQAKLIEEKDSLLKDIKSIKEQISSIYGGTTWRNFTKDNQGEEFYKVKIEESKVRTKKLEEELTDLMQQLADMKAILRDMESSDSYSTLSYRYTMEKEELKQKAEKWATLKVAKEMLKETKRTYEEKYLSLVIAKTTIYFKQITGGKYIRVLAPGNELRFTVESNDHIIYDVSELSKGTLDQLYIALRISISEIMSEKHNVPFILDDVFVHFDHARLKIVLEVIDQIAKQQQVILFTCKKEVIEKVPNHSSIYL